MAVKLIKGQFIHDTKFIKKFKLEIQAQIKLSAHPNIVPILDWGETSNGAPFIVMPYIPGKNLRSINTLSSQEVSNLINELESALRFAHRQKLTHGDVTPHNIIFGKDGHFYLIDFGISKAIEGTTSEETLAVAPIGKPAFLPLEVVDGSREKNATDDYYMLGMSAYVLTTGDQGVYSDNVLKNIELVKSKNIYNLKLISDQRVKERITSLLEPIDIKKIRHNFKRSTIISLSAAFLLIASMVIWKSNTKKISISPNETVSVPLEKTSQTKKSSENNTAKVSKETNSIRYTPLQLPRYDSKDHTTQNSSLNKLGQKDKPSDTWVIFDYSAKTKLPAMFQPSSVRNFGNRAVILLRLQKEPSLEPFKSNSELEYTDDLVVFDCTKRQSNGVKIVGYDKSGKQLLSTIFGDEEFINLNKIESGSFGEKAFYFACGREALFPLSGKSDLNSENWRSFFTFDSLTELSYNKKQIDRTNSKGMRVLFKEHHAFPVSASALTLHTQLKDLITDLRVQDVVEELSFNCADLKFTIIREDFYDKQGERIGTQPYFKISKDDWVKVKTEEHGFISQLYFIACGTGK